LKLKLKKWILIL